MVRNSSWVMGSIFLLMVKQSTCALTPSRTSNGTPHSVSSSQCTEELALIEPERLRQTVGSGRVYQHENFLSEEQVQVLLRDIQRLADERKMLPSGLSNTNKKEQNFDKNDRVVGPAPWWGDSLAGRDIENFEHLQVISKKIQKLRLQVSEALDRPTMVEAGYAHECYYSKSGEGSSLARHLDEFHEETKGPRGWLLPSRRSISWLIYLSDEDWDVVVNGGELRSFPQKEFIAEIGSTEVGSHKGNLQIGWLDRDVLSIPSPVYLDSWYKPPGKRGDAVEPHCALYVVEDGSEKYITMAWISTMMVASMTDFIKAQSKIKGQNIFIGQEFTTGFRLIEDRDTWVDGAFPPGTVTEDIPPVRGSIVMFDSVTVPHEVRVVKEGTRAAVAGWFHEETQPIPEGFY
mmetsp:Transcript_6725/g.9651  ORF Transcript_6725/g.9651 Transcript_6725/m.9651 type:complete len:403 (+) Transcript_6725:100-1308(+)